jgi:hypothetical protein
MAMPKLLVVAPEEMRLSLESGLAPLEAELYFAVRAEPGRVPSDPFGLQNELSRRPPGFDGALLIAPRRHAPGRLVPSLLVAGVPVGIVQADRPSQLQPWLQAVQVTQQAPQQPLRASMAMGKDFYLEWGDRLLGWMRAGGGEIGASAEDWTAVRLSRTDLCRSLARGPDLAIYCGHARARGWSGYQGVRWEHVMEEEQQRPCRLLITLGCHTLSRTRGVVPFGCQWINSGRASAYLAPAGALKVSAGEQIARILGEHLASLQCRSAGELLIAMDKHLSSEPQLAEAYGQFLAFRLIGNPFQRF